MKQKRLIIFHFRDISKYPPILNLMEFLSLKGCGYQVVSVQNLGFKNFISWINSIQYFMFTIKTLFTLSFTYKSSILYYESISSIPFAIYFFIFPYSRRPLYIHFHEYYSLKDYKRQSFYERLGRKLETRLFERSTWISHTNQNRADLFLNEFPNLNRSNLKVMPNYPPLSWIKPKSNKKTEYHMIKLVHIGSLSTKGLYLTQALKKFGNNKKFTIDFYSHNFSREVIELISDYDNCKIKGSIAYEEIKTLKGIYDVGLVLYDGTSLNFKYNAPNKIFEYLALDLDVWCSDKLVTAKDYERLDCHPKMLMVDFEQLDAFDVDKALNKTSLPYVESPYICEPVYQKLLESILKEY